MYYLLEKDPIAKASLTQKQLSRKQTYKSKQLPPSRANLIKYSYEKIVLKKHQCDDEQSYDIGNSMERQFHLSKDKKKNKYQPQGLPNIGNNCFLNSVLQFLFSATAFRMVLIDKYKKAQNITHTQNESILIGKIFFLLEEKQEKTYQKQLCLFKLMKKLEVLNLDYQLYSQECVKQTLTNLIKNIDYTEDEFEAIQRFFNIEILMTCKCPNGEVIIDSLFLMKQSQYCKRCKSNYTIQLQNDPNYLIYIDKKQTGTPFIRKGYSIISKIRYFGDGKSGHYICERVVNGKEYSISDNTVQEISQPIQRRQREKETVLDNYKDPIKYYFNQTKLTIDQSSRLNSKPKKQTEISNYQQEQINKLRNFRFFLQIIKKHRDRLKNIHITQRLKKNRRVIIQIALIVILFLCFLEGKSIIFQLFLEALYQSM